MSTSRTRYAVVSCHVERPLDDLVWDAFTRLQAARPAGFAVAALLRPPDAAAGEDEARWLERARQAAQLGPLGHHTHWTSPAHARPTQGEEPGARVLREGAWLAGHGLTPSLFCGGGWYTERSVMRACAVLGYVDCTPRARRPAYLGADERWAELDRPACVVLPGGGRARAFPTTHSIGDLARAVVRPGGLQEELVHVYLHDTDLLDRRRRAALRAGLAVLARRRTPSDLDRVAAATHPPDVPWEDVRRGGSAGEPE
jgi:hypothetical protein